MDLMTQPFKSGEFSQGGGRRGSQRLEAGDRGEGLLEDKGVAENMDCVQQLSAVPS